MWYLPDEVRTKLTRITLDVGDEATTTTNFFKSFDSQENDGEYDLSDLRTLHQFSKQIRETD